MKLLIDRGAFMKVLQRMQGIVEKRNTMPILANVLLEASENKVNILATDLEVFIRDSAPASVAEGGSVTVNARKIYEIVKELPDDIVDISTKEEKTSIKGGKARFSILGLPARDFPVFPAIDEKGLAPVDNDVLKELIDKTSFAVSTDETRYNINGFYLEKDGPLLRMVATDGHRLAFIEKNDAGGMMPGHVLLPRKGVMEIRRLLDEEGSFFLGVTQKNAIMKKDDTVISLRLLEGEFPDYRKVMPKEHDKSVVIDRAGLLSSLKRVSILSSEKIKGVKFSFSGKSLTVSSSSPDIGDASEELDAEYGGETLDIAFNARYFMDVLEAIDEEKVRIELKDSLNPGIIKPSQDYTYIIMPMRL